MKSVKFIAMIYALTLLLVLRARKLCDRSTKFESSGGIYKIIGLFPVRHVSAEMYNNGLLWTELMAYTITKENQKFGRRKLFDFVIYDNCGPAEIDATTDAITGILLSANYATGLQCPCLSQDTSFFHTLGMIGPATSGNSIYVSKLLSFLSIPLISYAATSPQLSNKENYPNFFRTVPPDTFQATFIKDILLELKWTYISMIGTDTSYGRMGAAALNKEITNSSICVAVEEIFSIPHNKDEVRSIIQKLKKETLTQVIVLWGSFQPVKDFLTDARQQKLHDKVWIISEASGRNKWFNMEQNKVLGKFLSISPVSGRNHDFEKYFFNLKLSDTIHRPFLKAFFNHQGINETHNNETKLQKFAGLFTNSRAGSIQNAIFTYVHSLLRYVNDTISCNITDPSCPLPSIQDHRHFIDQYIKKVEFSGLLNDSVRYDLNGDVTSAWFDLYIATGNNTLNFQQIIQWASQDGLLFIDTELISVLNTINATCASVCLPGFYPIFNPVKKCCWICVKCKLNEIKATTSLNECIACPTGEVSNEENDACILLKMVLLEWYSTEGILIITLSLVGMVITLFIIFTFVKFRNTPIVRSSYLSLSMAQLVVHFILFGCPLLYFYTDTILKCAVRTYAFGLLFTIIIAVTLAKVTNILMVFNMKYILTKAQIIQRRNKQYLIFVLTLAIDIGLAATILLMKPISITIKKDFKNFLIQRSCNDDDHNMIQIGYIFLLQVINGGQAYRGRKIPSKYNEAKYIAITMFISALVFIADISLLQSFTKVDQKNLLSGMIIIILNYIFLIILYGYKVVLIWIYPHENSKKIFQKSRMKRVNCQTIKRLSKRRTEQKHNAIEICNI